jgi:hypothetical protein
MPPENEEDEKLDLRAQLSAALDASGDEEDAGDLSTDDQGTDENAASSVSRETSGQPRDDQGRWTKAQREQAERDAAAAAATDPNARPAADPNAPIDLSKAMPPPGWPPAAKAEFGKLPETVRAAIVQREEYINRGFQKLQDYKGMEPYVEMAKANNTTLPEAFERYHAAEEALEKDFPRGVAALCQMYNIHPMQLAQHFAQVYGGARRQPDGNVQPQDGGRPDPMGLIMRRLDGIEQKFSTLTSREEEAAEAEIRSEIDAFRSENIYFEDVKADMAALIREGRANSLQQAYDKACRLNDEIYALIIKDQGAPSDNARRMDQHRRAASSLPAGSPLPNARPEAGDPKASIRADLERNWNVSSI